MEFAEREFLLARIVAGCLPCNLRDRNTGRKRLYLLKTPSRLQRLIAQRVYWDAFHEAELDGVLSDKELRLQLIEDEVWDPKNDETLTSLEKDIEELKIRLFQMTFQSQEQKLSRKLLDKARDEYNRLASLRDSYSHTSVSGTAALARSRYLVGASLHYPNGQPVFVDEDAFWRGDNSILEAVVEVHNKERIDEKQYRELARTEPWRSIWNARKAEGSVFGIPACDLSDDQKTLVMWTSTYDGIFEHPECPDDKVVQDDDVLDGWMLVQQRKRTKEREQSKVEQMLGSDKIRNSEEVFVMAQTPEDARAIDELNDTGAAITKRRRMAMIRQKGEVDEREMPDSKLKIQQLISEKYREWNSTNK